MDNDIKNVYILYASIICIGYGAGSELPSNLIILTDILEIE